MKASYLHCKLHLHLTNSVLNLSNMVYFKSQYWGHFYSLCILTEYLNKLPNVISNNKNQPACIWNILKLKICWHYSFFKLMQFWYVKFKTSINFVVCKKVWFYVNPRPQGRTEVTYMSVPDQRSRTQTNRQLYCYQQKIAELMCYQNNYRACQNMVNSY